MPFNRVANGVVPGASGQTTAGTPIKASDQVTNMQTGNADHLDLGMRKQT
jgi:hypothetical protein